MLENDSTSRRFNRYLFVQSYLSNEASRLILTPFHHLGSAVGVNVSALYGWAKEDGAGDDVTETAHIDRVLVEN